MKISPITLEYIKFINSLNKEELQEILDTEFLYLNSSVSSIERIKLSEGLIKTYDIKNTTKIIEKRLGLKRNQYKVQEGENGIEVIAIYTDKENKDGVMKILDLCGYYVTNELKKWRFFKRGYILEFRPKFTNTTELQKFIREYPILWHVTTEEKLEKIKKQGFVPKSSNTVFDYPSRIHFLAGTYSLNDAEKMLSIIREKSENKDSNWKIIKVDVRKKDGNIPIFHYDPDFPGAVYTYENIPANIVFEIDAYNPKMSLQECVDYIKKALTLRKT